MVAAFVIVVSYLQFYQLLSPNIHFVYRFFYEEHLFPFYVHHTVSQIMFLTKQHTTEKVYQIDGCLCNTLSQVAVVCTNQSITKVP